MKLFDREENYIGNLKYVLAANHSEEINGEDILEFTTLDNRVEKGFRVSYKDIYGYWKEFIIRGIEEAKQEDGTIKYIYCESSFYETIGDYIEDKRPSGQASIALLSALETSRWEVGVVDSLGDNQTNFYHISVKEAVQKVAETWKGEIRTRVEISGNKISKRYVDLLSRRGHDLGKRFTYTKDIEEIKRIIHRDDVVTALYGYGKGEELDTGGFGRRITFGDINNCKDYVENNEAKEIWGRNNPDGTKSHVFGKAEFDDCEDKEELLQLTQEKLEEVSKPLVTYECKVIDLKAYGLYHEGTELGDTVAVIDKNFEPELRLKARVIKINRDILEPQNNEIVLGNFIPSIIDSTLEDKFFIDNFRDKQGIWDRSEIIKKDGSINANILNDLIDELNERMNSQGGYVYISEDGKGLATYDKPIDQGPTMAIQLLGGAFRIADNKLPNGEWNWRTFGTGKGFVADMITAGTLDAGLIKSGVLASHDGSSYIDMVDGSFNFKNALKWVDGVLNINSPDIPNVDDVVLQNAPYNNVKISSEKGLEVMDNYNRQRVQLGNYTFGKYGLLLKDSSGTKTILDEDGMLQSWQEGKVGNVDKYSPLILNVYIPENTRYISKSLLRFKMEHFRAYSKSAISTEESTIASQNSVENTISSQNSAEFSTTSAAGGGGTKTTHGGVDVEWIYPDTQPGGEDGHTHTYKRVQSHAHDIILEDHTHTIKIPPHEHEIIIPPHEHEIIIPPHEHEIEYGIFEGEIPSNITITINGTNYTRYLGGTSGFNEDRDNLDITTLLEKGTWNTIEIGSSTMGRIDASIFIQCFMNTIRNSVILDETYLKTFKIRTGMGLGEVSVAPRRTQLHSNPDMIFEAHVIRGVIEATTKEWRTLDIEGWAQQFIIRGAKSVAVAFDGNWAKDEMGKYQFLTDDKPYIFWVNEEGRLFVRLWDEEDTTKELAQDVVKVKALRGWKNVSVSKSDYGLIAAYIKADGKVYYRNYCNQGDSAFMWEDERQVEEFTGTVKNISLFNTNDYRTGLMIEDSNSKMHWLITKRNWAGMAIAPERIIAKPNINVDFIETTKHRGYCIERITSKPNIALDFLYASSFNEFTHIENIDDGTGNFGIKVKIKTKYRLYNCLSSEFRLTDGNNISFNCEDIENISPNEFVLTFIDFNNADREVKLSYTRTNGTNEAGYAFDDFEGTFMPTGLVPAAIPVPEVEVIWNE